MRGAARLRSEGGFTLVELLVVCLIIGILVAIALSGLSGQSVKAQDADAKSNARNIVTVVEACNANENEYRQCESEDVPGIRDAGIALGGGRGQVLVSSDARRSFTIMSRSKSGNVFRMTVIEGGGVVRTCTVGAGDQGGCRVDGTW